MKHLGLHQRSHQYWLNLMNQSQYKSQTGDCYNQGPLVSELENRVARLLNKPKTLFFNKGTTCQLAALKTICNKTNNQRVVLHPKSHIALDEQDAYQELMGLKGILIGHENAPFSIKELEAVSPQVAVLTVELPLRRVGFKLTEWDELLKMRQWCDEHGVHFHLDGARLWESTHWYKKTEAEICSLFDSVYVSLYKGIGGMSGALLAGSDEYLKQCQVWRDRLGSNMYTTFPALITGLEGLDRNLTQIPSWVDRAHEISSQLNLLPELTVETPHTNGFWVKLKGDKVTINQKLKQIQTDRKLTLCRPFESLEHESFLYTEIQVGAEHQNITTSEITQFFKDLLSR